MRSIHTFLRERLVSTIVATSLVFPSLLNADVASDLAVVENALGATQGVIAHLGDDSGEFLAALGETNIALGHGLMHKEDAVESARRLIMDSGSYGRVSVEQWERGPLPYIDDFINLILIEPDFAVDQDEVQRVLAPRGLALWRTENGWRRWVKPVPEEIDDWTHYFHDASGNAVADDDRVGPPRHLQWVGSPRWSRHHDRMASMSALVSSAGKLFYIMDEGSRVSIQLPSSWKLIARDAFNGSILWKRDIPKWHSRLWPLKSGPTQLTRRLVADDGAVFVTLSIDGPTERLDPLTGASEFAFPGTEGTEEIVYSQGVVYMQVRHGKSELEDYAPKFNVGDQRRVRTEFVWNEEPREIVAADANTGQTLWTLETKIAPLTLSVHDDRVFFYNGERVVCLDRLTGEERWTGTPAGRRALIAFNFGPRLTLYENIALFAGGDGKMTAYDAGSGRQLWEATHDRSGYESPQDLLVVGGKVWSAPLTSGRDSGVFTGRDPITGVVESSFAPDEETYWFHHRCYISKATENFILSSRTGIEFVDHEAEDWRINHWVRGGCLYGVMPANGMTYAPPHNCACYPEAKLYGLNALATQSSLEQFRKTEPEGGRLIHGPAFGEPIPDHSHEGDWPTYRGNNARSGYQTNELSRGEMPEKWTADLGGKLSALTVAEGLVFVAEIERHTVRAMDRKTGETRWTFTTGGRVDSPPTIERGKAIFGSADGWVYCLRATDGALIWKFRGAPFDRRLMAFEGLESVWPVHGSVLVEDGAVSTVAGRSIFLDGGLRFLRLDAATGELLVEAIVDDRDPDTGGDIQDRLETLQMPVGLSDILSSDGEYTYLRSQKFLPDGTRTEVGPVSGNPAVQGGTHQGDGDHLFAPMGFLDDTWFHRAYWVYGKNFAGGHSGYFQAGKYAPSGRILVHDEETVYGFGREPKYLKWTTPLEHQLFAASREVPKVAPNTGGNNRPAGPIVTFPIRDNLDPTGKEITVEAWVLPDTKRGVIAAHGGPSNGYALTLANGKPRFLVRASGQLATAVSDTELDSGWNHIVGVLDADRSMKLYLNGRLAGHGKTEALISGLPVQPLDLGADSGSAVGSYQGTFPYTGLIDEFAVFFRPMNAEEVAARFQDPETARTSLEGAVVACDFDSGAARDRSAFQRQGQVIGVAQGRGKVGSALWFRAARNTNNNATARLRQDSYVERDWSQRIPFFARAMALAGDTLIVAGPPDYIDEDESFDALMEEDPSVIPLLEKQEAALEGADGGSLWTFSTSEGRVLQRRTTESLPVWDGLAVSAGDLFYTDTSGAITCFGSAD